LASIGTFSIDSTFNALKKIRFSHLNSTIVIVQFAPYFNMTILRNVVIATALSSTLVNAFTITNIANLRAPAAAAATRVTSLLRMAGDESEDGTFVKSVLKKEIVYDEKAGRFFETNFGEGDCVPDEEYCYLDQSTGESIRLTVEEKERIFMDALQVRFTSSLFIKKIILWLSYSFC
jgi:hypothetical protein